MNLSSNIDFDIKHFFLWWGRELAFWVPEKLREALSNKTGYVFLTVTSEVLQFSRIHDGEQHFVAEVGLDEKGQEEYQQLISEEPELENAKYIVRLSSEQAVKKILYLPAAAKENLQQVVAFEIDKYTPFNAEQVYFSIKILEKEQNGQIKVLLVLTPKEILDNVSVQMHKLNIYPTVIDYVNAANDFSEDLDIYNLLPEWQRPGQNKTTKITIAVLSFVLLMLTMAVLVYPVWSEGRAVDGLRLQLKQLEKDARIVQEQQLEVDEIIEKTSRLLESKNSKPRLTGLINTLSQLMPTDTWLTHLKYDKNNLQIQGQSASASALIGVMEASPLFANARFVSPLTQDKKTGFERFQISVEVKSQGGDDVE
ncbi:MAG: PilN domain-containing protein [Methylococcaceae bacterium]